MPVRLGRDPLRYHHSPANSKTASTLKQGSKMSMEEAKKNRKESPDTPSNLGSNASKDIAAAPTALLADRSEEHTSELKSLMRISFSVSCFKKKTPSIEHSTTTNIS